MKFSLKAIPILLLLCFVISCEVEDEIVLLPVPDCVTAVTYRGTNVCSEEPSAAAVELADSSFLIINNFFDFADSMTIMDGGLVNVSYDAVDSTLFNSGALCGAAIVAPIAEITCFSEN